MKVRKKARYFEENLNPICEVRFLYFGVSSGVADWIFGADNETFIELVCMREADIVDSALDGFAIMEFSEGSDVVFAHAELAKDPDLLRDLINSEFGAYNEFKFRLAK